MFYPTVLWIKFDSPEEMQTMIDAMEKSPNFTTQDFCEEDNSFSFSPMTDMTLTEVDQELARLYDSGVSRGRVRDSHKCSAKHVMGMVDSYKRKNRK